MKEITASELQKLISAGRAPQLIDVRETYEHEDYNIGGFNMPLGELMNYEAELKSLSQQGDIVLYCRSGNRSGMAQKLLAMRMGIENTINLKGGILAWLELPPAH